LSGPIAKTVVPGLLILSCRVHRRFGISSSLTPAKKSALLSEPARTFAQVNAILERAFKRLGPPAEITTDGAEEFPDDSFRKLLASFGVRHIVRTDTLNQGPVERFVRSKSKGKTT
jgi:hypothetical protein